MTFVVKKLGSAVGRGLNEDVFSINCSTAFREVPSLLKTSLYFLPFLCSIWNLKYKIYILILSSSFTIFLLYQDLEAQESQSTEQDPQSIEETAIVDNDGIEETVLPVAILQTPKAAHTGKLPTSSSVSKAKKRRHQELTTAVSELRQLNQTLQEPAAEDDEYDLFGRYLGRALKKLKPHLAVQCQAEVQSTITRYRLMSIAATDRNRMASPSDTSEYSNSRPSTGSDNIVYSNGRNFQESPNLSQEQDYEEMSQDISLVISNSIAGPSTSFY